MCLHRSPTTLWPVASNKMRLEKSYKINSDEYHTGDLVQGVKRKKMKYAGENCLFNPSSNSGFHNGHPGKWCIPLILYSMLIIYCSSIINLGLKFTLIKIYDCEMPNIFLNIVFSLYLGLNASSRKFFHPLCRFIICNSVFIELCCLVLFDYFLIYEWFIVAVAWSTTQSTYNLYCSIQYVIGSDKIFSHLTGHLYIPAATFIYLSTRTNLYLRQLQPPSVNNFICGCFFFLSDFIEFCCLVFDYFLIYKGLVVAVAWSTTQSIQPYPPTRTNLYLRQLQPPSVNNFICGCFFLSTFLIIGNSWQNLFCANCLFLQYSTYCWFLVNFFNLAYLYNFIVASRTELKWPVSNLFQRCWYK